MHDREFYSTKADLWSVGIILYEITTGQTPFAARSLQELTWKLRTQPITFPQSAHRLSRECKDLISRLLRKNPHQRISWEDFFNHPWFGAPITLPQEMQQYVFEFIRKMPETKILCRSLDPAFERDLADCLIIAQLADNLASEYGRHGEMLTLYMQFLSEMRDLYRSMPDDNRSRKYPCIFVFY
ncbi:MAG: protein kinase [Cytophagales bacterium]|nr:protein kinase [Cytophagales bacterium]